MSPVYLHLSTGEDKFKLHSVKLELEAMEKQIRDILMKQAQLQEQKAVLEFYWMDAHLYQVNLLFKTNTSSTSTPFSAQVKHTQKATSPGVVPVYQRQGIMDPMDDVSLALGENLSPSFATNLQDLHLERGTHIDNP